MRHCGDVGSPAGRGSSTRGGRRLPRYSAGSDDETDESLAQSVSKLDISSECLSASMCRSAISSSCSPPEPGSSQAAGGSKRRSISDMSPSARMTPLSMERRGLGVPWLKQPALCTMDLQAGEVGDEAINFCLLTTPELIRQQACRSPLSSPDVHSPSAMQRKFRNSIHRASLSPCASDAQGTPMSPDQRSPSPGFGESLDVAAPDHCMLSGILHSPSFIAASHQGSLLADGGSYTPTRSTVCSPAYGLPVMHTICLQGRLQGPDAILTDASSKGQSTFAEATNKQLRGHHSKENEPPRALSMSPACGRISVCSLVQKFERRCDMETSLQLAAPGTFAHARRSMSRSPVKAYQRSKRSRP